LSFQYLIKVPDDRIGVLIGKNGKVKSEIEEKCKVQLEINSSSGDVVVSSSYEPLSEMLPFKAIEIISAISKGFSPQRANLLLRDEDLIFQIIDLKEYAGKSSNTMDRIKGRIIGQAGKSRSTHKTVYEVLQQARRKNKLDKIRLWEQDSAGRD